MSEHEHNGIKFEISQKAIDELKKFHNIDAISEIELAIEKEQAADLENNMSEQARGIQYPGEETQLVLVECIHQYRMRYVVEVPFGHADWALDTVTMEEAKEFSQLSLGETIVSHRVVSRDEVLKLCDEDNDYCSSWTDEEKIEAFVSFDNDDLMEF